MTEIANRVGTFMQRSSLVRQMMVTQKRLYETQTQLVTEQKSQDYAGIAYDSFRLVSIETERTMVQRFSQGNSLAQVRLETMSSSVSAVKSRLHSLRDDLSALGASGIDFPLNDADLQALDDIQSYSFAALQDMTFYLNAKSDGRYVFAGGRTDQKAVDLPYSTLGAFQAEYDGVDVAYPDTRAKHVPNVKLTPDEYGTLDFTTANQVTASVGGTIFDQLVEGSIIQFTGQDGADQYFRIAQNLGGGVIQVEPDPQAHGLTGAAENTQTIESVSYYNGDDLEFEHRVNERRTLQLGLNAKDPAFEKAIRALGLLSQGGLYTPEKSQADTGGLTFASGPPDTLTAGNPGAFDDIPIGAQIYVEGSPGNEGKTLIVDSINAAGDQITFTTDSDAVSPAVIGAGTTHSLSAMSKGRIDQALSLINDALDHDPNNTAEQRSDVEEVIRLIGFNQVTLDTAIDDARTYDAFLESRQVDIEQANTIDAATRLQDDARALEISFQSYARISQLSLQKFL